VTRIEELQRELDAEIKRAIAPLNALREAARAVVTLGQTVDDSTRRLEGSFITDGSLKANAKETRAVLYFMNERALRMWNEAVRAFLGSAVVDSLGTEPIVCPSRNSHVSDRECWICRERLIVGDVLVEVTSR
jgi:alkylation response protein AidB-like acyl-CoA dehydrogenase